MLSAAGKSAALLAAGPRCPLTGGPPDFVPLFLPAFAPDLAFEPVSGFSLNLLRKLSIFQLLIKAAQASGLEYGVNSNIGFWRPKA
jgi:hypothetical protein